MFRFQKIEKILISKTFRQIINNLMPQENGKILYQPPC
jgi:hypothetical protein